MNSLQPVYCIAGLGADFRIFENLRIPNATLYPIAWKEPLHNESLPDYAKRLSSQILHEDAILLGVSFGGMIATEISKHKPIKQTIIISSCKSNRELPYYLRLAGMMRLHQVVPYWVVTRSSTLNRIIFDTRSEREELLLKQLMLKHSNPTWLKRFVNMILKWQNTEIPAGIFHIHGRNDRLLLPGKVNANAWLPDGGHFMIWNKAAEISRIIEKQIQA
jgi:pimeloyl-ACP methyl ester carboxylesterase